MSAPGGCKEQLHGFAAVDALVALTVLATTLALALQAEAVARRLAGSALRSEQAGVLLQYLIETGARTPGKWTGRSGGLDWRFDVALQPADPRAGALRTCRRTATASEAGGRRTVSLTVLAFCRPPADPTGAG